MAAPTPAEAAPVENATEATLLHELVSALEQSDQPVADNVQAVVERAKKPPAQPPATAKTVRQAFDKLEKKRKQLTQAQKARTKLHKSWADYLQESIKRWKGFAEDFAKKDKDLEQRVQEASEAVQDARTKYDQVKEDNDRQDAAIMDNVEEISDGMEGLEEDAPDKMATSEEIQAGIASVLSGLETFAKPIEAEHTAKKARLTEDGSKEGSGFGSGALKPFPAPSK